MQLENLFIDLRMFKGRGIHTCNAPSTYTEQELFAHTGEKKVVFPYQIPAWEHKTMYYEKIMTKTS